MDPTDEIAHFRPDDDGCLVAASLSCPVCLSSAAVRFELSGPEEDARAHCACRLCGHERDVYLTVEQALRLSLHARCPLDLTPHPRDALVAF